MAKQILVTVAKTPAVKTVAKVATPRVLRNKPAAKTAPVALALNKVADVPAIVELLMSEPAPVVVAPVAPVQAQKKISFYIAEGMRAGSGALLFAHTDVFLEYTGMKKGATVPGNFARLVMGNRAVKWHTDKGNFIGTATGLCLSEVGKAAFAKRNIDAEMRAGFEAVLLEGKPDDRCSVKGFIHAIR